LIRVASRGALFDSIAIRTNGASTPLPRATGAGVPHRHAIESGCRYRRSRCGGRWTSHARGTAILGRSHSNRRIRPYLSAQRRARVDHFDTLSTRRFISYYSAQCDAWRERYATLPRDRPPPAALRHVRRAACDTQSAKRMTVAFLKK